jgi:transposase
MVEEAKMKVYAGIDLHSTNSVLSFVDENGQLLRERRYPNELPVIIEALTPYREQLVGVVVESTYNWYWLVDGLMAAGFPVRLAHAAAIPQYAGLKHGDDFTDARHLANLLRLGILPEGYIYPSSQRGLRDLLRRRRLLVREQTRQALALQSLWTRHTGHPLRDLPHLTLTELSDRFTDTHVRESARVMWTLWQVIHREIQAVERGVRKEMKHSPDLAHLQSTPGIGDILGQTILLETGAIERFHQVGDYASYCRCVDSKRLSNGKAKGHGNAKSGNRHLAWAYIEAANYAIRFSPPIKSWFDRKRRRCHRMVALKAVAHKLARACYFILRGHTDFDLVRAFG